MDKLMKRLYKRNHICQICERVYGSDAKIDNGECPICRSAQEGKGSRLLKLHAAERMKRKKKKYKAVYQRGRK